VRSACAPFLGCPHETFAELSRSLLCTLVSFESADTQQTAGAQRTLAGGSRPFWEGLCVGFSRHMGVGVLATRAEGARKVHGRWSADAGLRVEFKTSPSPCPAAVQRVLSGFSAGFQKVLGRCPICRLDRKWLDLDPFPAGAGRATHVRCPYGADSDSGPSSRCQSNSRIWRVAVNDERLRPVIGRGGLVVVLKRDQVLTACAARGLSLEELRLAAGISRPTLQAALRGKRVRPRTALKLARALNRHPVLEEIRLLLEAS
jgi:lambda repressor-like predicted transcriptional regulator